MEIRDGNLAVSMYDGRHLYLSRREHMTPMLFWSVRTVYDGIHDVAYRNAMAYEHRQTHPCGILVKAREHALKTG
ncbi:hypothetical protein ACFLZO_01520, partial [Patescibacteria group bacterium]